MIESSPTIKKRYLNTRELADYIDSTEASVRQLVHHRRVPFIKVAGGRRVLFDLREIDQWMASEGVKTIRDAGTPRGNGPNRVA
jgi:excisionase family DNA binding protein